MYAVVKTGGRQFKVAEGQSLRVEKLDAAVGDTVELGEISLIARDEGLVVDPKALEQAKVVCQVTKQGLGKKVRVFKKKRRKGYQRTKGHRQAFTEIKVQSIQA